MIIQSDSINDCWESCIRYLSEHYENEIIAGRECAVIYNILLVLNSHNSIEKLSRYCLWTDKIKTHYLQAIDQVYYNPEIDRMFNYSDISINQYNYVIRILKAGNIEKPIIISIYDPCKDSNVNAPSPCLTYIEFNKFQNRLQMYVNYSSINLYRLGLLDFYQVAYIHEKIAKEANIPVGELTIRCTKAFVNIPELIVCNEIFRLLEYSCNETK